MLQYFTELFQERVVFMKAIDIYHGSNQIVYKPRILVNGYYKDFGYGFYCTEIQKQAKRWALTKRGKHIVNVYKYVENNDLRHKKFLSMTDEWLNFIAECRHGAEHTYDIVEGPMADDQVWDYVEDYLKGNISRDAFWELAKFRYPTHQIVFCSESSLKTISFKGSIKL